MGEFDHKSAQAKGEVKTVPDTAADATKDGGQTEAWANLHRQPAEDGWPQAGATTVVYMADSGETAEVALSDALACANCIISFRRNGGSGAVLPGHASCSEELGVAVARG